MEEVGGGGGQEEALKVRSVEEDDRGDKGGLVISEWVVAGE